MQDACLNSDISGEQARALHRVVRAMHDGNCPKCGYLGPSSEFEFRYANAPGGLRILDHICPKCKFRIGYKEAEAALEAFRPYMQANVEIFEKWREEFNRLNNAAPASA